MCCLRELSKAYARVHPTTGHRKALGRSRRGGLRFGLGQMENLVEMFGMARDGALCVRGIDKGGEEKRVCVSVRQVHALYVRSTWMPSPRRLEHDGQVPKSLTENDEEESAKVLR
eukprot:comp18548_c0_seq1/m.19998 comp18548_c0_seq1/g.19998  ORF comp18548_c0_seq1/g.19998 comp18548_c0_seq1/m.19998 type:complete len:115 (+) comp18548_c0_seq1:721-1065(+)